jgi:hypothetical protein
MEPDLREKVHAQDVAMVLAEKNNQIVIANLAAVGDMEDIATEEDALPVAV